jgi:hypothetical protein
VKVLEEGMKLPAKTRSIILEAVPLGKVDAKKPRPIKVRAAVGKCREVLRRGKDLKDLKGFGDIYVRPDRTASERQEFAKSLKTAWELKQRGKDVWVNYQGVVKVRDGGRIKT